MRRRGRPVLGGISGFFFGLFLGLDLLFYGLVALDSILLTILPIVGLVLGVVLGLRAPLRRGRGARREVAPAPPPPPATQEPAPIAAEPTEEPTGD